MATKKGKSSMPMNSMRKNICFIGKKRKVRWFLTVFLKRKRELVDKPGSVVDNHSSRRIFTHTLKQPTRILNGPFIGFLFGLATSGVYPATNRYRRHGALLPHPFNLT